jgi:hypothetical protein
MGFYEAYLSGRIIIDPPLSWPEIADSPFYHKGTGTFDHVLDLKLEVREEPVNTPDGPLLKRMAPALIPLTTELLSLRGPIVYQIEKFLERHTLPARVIKGAIVGRGADPGTVDIWRIVVKSDGQVLDERASLTWPDGIPVVLD